MARGGQRSGAGRKKGSTCQKTKERRALVESAIAGGTSPLTYMLEVMRDKKADQKRRDAMAIAAAPFVHPRLSSIDGDLSLHLYKHEEALAELE